MTHLGRASLPASGEAQIKRGYLSNLYNH